MHYRSPNELWAESPGFSWMKEKISKVSNWYKPRFIQLKNSNEHNKEHIVFQRISNNIRKFGISFAICFVSIIRNLALHVSKSALRTLFQELLDSLRLNFIGRFLSFARSFTQHRLGCEALLPRPGLPPASWLVLLPATESFETNIRQSHRTRDGAVALVSLKPYSSGR